jgi:RNA polymerase sigma-70 factor (ECF subfamily)
MNSSSDQELVKRCLKGEIKAFEILVNRYQKSIFNIVLRITRDYDEAEDITQNVFIKIYENLSNFKMNFQFSSWIYRIAVNESLNSLKVRKVYEPLNNTATPSFESSQNREDSNKLQFKLQRAIAALDPSYRVVIILKHFQECSYKAIATILELPEKTVKSRLYTARQLLRDALVKEELIPNEG